MSDKLIPHPDLPLDLPTAQRIQAAVDHYGEQAVVENAIAILRGENAGKDFLLYAGGRHALGILNGAPALYWPELWGARALLHVWGESAAPNIVAGLGNQAWRVREMCARVIQLRELDAAPQLVAACNDDVPRVRAAAVRALAAQGSGQHMDAIEHLLGDPDKEVRRTAQQSRDALSKRLDDDLRS